MYLRRTVGWISLLSLAACGGTSAPPAPLPASSPSVSAPTLGSAAPAPDAGPPVGADGWIEFARGAWSVKVRPNSHALSRLGPLGDLVTAELAKVRKAMGVQDSECTGIVVYLHGDQKEAGAPTRMRAFARWADSGEVSAHYLAESDFDDRTDLFRSLVPNELVKATRLACLRRDAKDFIGEPNSPMAWLMEGEGTLLHTGGWFNRDVDALTEAYIAGRLDYPIEKILRADYRKACKFNPHVTHTFNIVEFPQMASFTRFLWASHGNARFNVMMRKVREAGEGRALDAIAEVYGVPVNELEKQWRSELTKNVKHDSSLDSDRIARLVRRYQGLREAAARALTFDNENVGGWGKRYAADMPLIPIVSLDFATAEPALERAREAMVKELKTSASLVEKGLGVKISLPVSRQGKTEEVLPNACVVTSVTPGGRGQKMGLQKGDEVHLLDIAIHDAVVASPTAPYVGALRVTRGAEGTTQLLPAQQ